MEKEENIKDFLEDLANKLKNEMPKIRKEIKVYEQKLKRGGLTVRPIPSPQFND